MIKLTDVSKYYASEDAVAIGLHKINLELNIGEFVAVTGESGSGKSTFLNVISGIDSYEEGEMTVFGEETSGFVQSDWERYRNDYISFVFQDYNIIDSYTVLQNVEIALLSRFPDAKERRKQALKLIDEVGLSDHKHHKGTKLSGGQKQRVVIARALAKDSPVIMADEPTGNLDSTTGKEIMELLYNMSKDRLVIVVTHNFEEIEPYATRKIRFFDGEIVEDVELKHVDINDVAAPYKPAPVKPLKKFLNESRVALTDVTAAPKKQLFLFTLFLICSFILIYACSSFVSTSQISGGSVSSIFNNTDPRRMIVKKADDSAFTAADISAIKETVGEKNVVMKDLGLDYFCYITTNDSVEYYYKPAVSINAFMPISLLDAAVMGGSRPSSDDEIFLVASSYKEEEIVELLNCNCYFSQGYYYPIDSEDNKYNTQAIENITISGYSIKDSNDTFGNSVTAYVSDALYQKILLNAVGNEEYFLTNTMQTSSAENYDFGGVGEDEFFDVSSAYFIRTDAQVASGHAVVYTNNSFSTGLNDFTLTTGFFKKTINLQVDSVCSNANYYQNLIILNPDDALELFYSDYYQASIFVPENKQSAMSNILQQKGFNTYYASSKVDLTIEYSLMKFIIYLIFFVVFLILYKLLYRISRNVFHSKKRDYVIMRSIGIERKNIEVILSLEVIYTALAAYIVSLIVLLILMFSNLKVGRILYNLSAGYYILVFVTMIVLALLLSYKYTADMFDETVKNSLRNKE